MTKPTTSYAVPAKPITGMVLTTKIPTFTGNPGKTATSYQVAGAAGGISLDDMTITLDSAVITLGDGVNLTLVSDKIATPTLALTKSTTGYA